MFGGFGVGVRLHVLVVLGFVSGYVVCYWFVWVVVVDNLVLEFVLGVGGEFSGLDLALDGASMWLL